MHEHTHARTHTKPKLHVSHKCMYSQNMLQLIAVVSIFGIPYPATPHHRPAVWFFSEMEGVRHSEKYSTNTADDHRRLAGFKLAPTRGSPAPSTATLLKVCCWFTAANSNYTVLKLKPKCRSFSVSVHLFVPGPFCSIWKRAPLFIMATNRRQRSSPTIQTSYFKLSAAVETRNQET